MIRKGARKVEVENSGLVVFLYDEAHEGRIEARAPRLLEGFDDRDDEALVQLARRGTLVAYEKLQDDDLALEVVVGRKLTRKELAPGLWCEPQEGFLRLPSGRLRIDGYDSLAIGPEEPEAEGGLVEVKPGDYVVAVYRLDLLAVEDSGADRDALPDEVVVLTRATQARKRKPVPAMLRVPREETEAPGWIGRYAIEGRRFRGLVRFDPDCDAFFLNLDPGAADALKLRPGMRIALEAAGAGRNYEAVYLGDESSTALPILRAWQSRKKPEGFTHASWVRDSEGSERDHLVFQAMDEHLDIESELRDRWIPASATFSRR